MCGIVGFIDKKDRFNQGEQEKLVKEMLRLIKHRGGEAEGIVTNKNITIGHTRLSIVDASPQANQPFTDSNSTLSFNGEIYNHVKLRKIYCAKEKIKSSSDTATLFELLKLFSIKKVLGLINGMYAFCFLNIKEQKLFLALDKMAIKPLYYIDSPEYFAWSSEIKAFKSLPEFKFEFNDECLKEYMTFRYIVGEKTLFKNVYKMLAGEYLAYSVKKHSFKKTQYCQLDKTEPKESLEKIIRKSVGSHLMGDNPVGIQLSGGVDSSLIALFAKNFSTCKLHSFSVGLKDKRWNEFSYSDLAANIVGTIHHKIIFSKSDFARLFPKLTYYFDEPVVHPNSIPMYLLAKQARKYTKVLLTGEGADELFYGYNRYFSGNFKNDTDILLSNSFNSPDTIKRIIKDRGREIYSERKNILSRAKGLNKIDKMSFYDIYTYLPHVLLRQDKAGMMANIENRVPFLYEPVIAHALNLKTKVGQFGGKTTLKKISLKYFPAELVLRKKCGFGLPISEWLKDKKCLLPYLDKLMDHPLIDKYFIKKELSIFIKDHLEGFCDHSSLLFSMISLTMWYDIFIGKPDTYIGTSG